jgi:Tol biopolymer transport system component
LGALAVAGVSLLGCAALQPNSQPSLGIFEKHADVGDTHIPGAVVYDPAAGSYRITGSGTNMWFKTDAFHFVWKQASGDLSIAADVTWIGASAQPHRKAGVIIRQSLDPGSPYADIMVHGNGLVALQYRDVQNGDTHEIQSNVTAPRRVRLERRGDFVYMSVTGPDGALHYAGGAMKLKLTGPYYLGLAVCSHDNTTSETAVLSDAEIAPLPPAPPETSTAKVESTLEVIDIASTDRRVVYNSAEHFEAPNWSPDGKYFLFNQNGQIYRLPVEGGTPTLIDSGPLHRINNDHGISPDGTRIALSDQSSADGNSRVYVLPVAGGAPRLITKEGPSYWHGWSPNGRTLAIVGFRNNDFDVYTVPAVGGRERQLTTAVGLDDGPDYSPDGKTIYFNSVRSGNMKIWRMKADGSDQQQVTFGDDTRDWFAHPSPDGKWIAYVSFGTDVEIGNHPANKDVSLQIMPTAGGEPQVIAKLFGGQGTMNVASWSPDSKSIAFVSYRLATP